ncbi:hypothetical protein V1264_009868 [Littorina saxatilis]
MAGSSNVSGPTSATVAYLQAYFVTIATILGTGILGLPVTLIKSGLYPFLISFFIDAVMQSVLIHFFVDLLQKACAVQMGNLQEESVPLNQLEDEETELGSDSNGDVVMKEFEEPSTSGARPVSPNLHLLGTIFLGCGCQQMFDVLIILQFIALLICYALAGSEAYAQVIGIDHFYVIPVFVWVLTFAIVFALQLIQPIISILTFLKGSVLLATTLVTFYVGVVLGRSGNNDFSYIAAPFLMGTVAIGGTINTMPFTFERIGYKKDEIKNYRLAVQLGLWTCVLLNILWCWSVLDIVPQTVLDACQREIAHSESMMVEDGPASPDLCFGELSLESAKINGEISTVPMTKILARDYPTYTWVAVLVQVFIMVSITVSYLTIGGALHHTLNGVMQSVLVKRGLDLERFTAPQTCCNKLKILSTCVSLLGFTAVFSVAMANPQGFVDILEKFASLTLNSQAGIFVFLMLLASRRLKGVSVPVPMAGWFHHLIWTIPIFFNGAVIMDIYSIIRDIINPQHLVPIMLNSTLIAAGEDDDYDADADADAGS